MGFQKNSFYVADIATTGAREIGDLFSHIDVLSIRQICRTLVLAPSDLIGMSLRLKIWLLLQCYLNPGEGVPRTSRLVKRQNQLKGFIIVQSIFCAIKGLAPFANRGVPLSRAGDHNATGCDEDWLWDAPVWLPSVNCRVDQSPNQTQLEENRMQPQTFWRSKYWRPLQILSARDKRRLQPVLCSLHRL
jgi:hypothetical protein